MRPIISRLSDIYNRRTRVGFTSSGSGTASSAAAASDVGAWRERAIREASLVRRVLRGTKWNDAGAAGATATVSALEAGSVRELLLTRQFIDSQPGAAENILALARASGVTTTVLSGVGAFELDLVAGGVGALLRRPLNGVAAAAAV